MEKESDRRFVYVDSEALLQELIKNLKEADRVVLDTEADSLHHYYEKVCLIQLSFNCKHYIVDPLSDISLDEFLSVLAKKQLILHGADFDLRMLKSCYEFTPKKPVFDTMIASQVLGYDKIGLAALVEKFFGVVLSKQGQKSDWAKRPLTEKQLDYAIDDTRYLEVIADKMTEEMKKLERLSWHQECCERLMQVTSKRVKKDPDEEWRIKGSGTQNSKTLVYIKELWKWRDGEAKKVDRPPFMVATNQLILDLAKWLAQNPRASLVKGPKLPRNLKGVRLLKLEKAIQKAKAVPQDKWPEQKRSKRPEDLPCKEEIKKLRNACKKVAEDLKIEPSFLAPKSAVIAIVVKRPKEIEQVMKVGNLMSWQVKLILPCLQVIQ